MATHVIAPNEELVLTGYLRDKLASTPWAAAFVSNRLVLHDGREVLPSEDYAVIVRSDGGPALEPPTFLRRFGIRIFGPDGDDNGMRTMALAAHVEVLLKAAPFHTSEVAATLATHGPSRVPPSVSRPEAYLTCELVLVGAPINI